MTRRLIRNAIRCNLCGDVVESTGVHNLRFCGCRQTGADGGLEYARRLGWEEDFTDLAEYEPDDTTDIR